MNKGDFRGGFPLTKSQLRQTLETLEKEIPSAASLLCAKDSPVGTFHPHDQPAQEKGSFIVLILQMS